VKINEAAKALHTSAWTLRYYEQIGVVAPVARVSGMRDYSAADLKQLREILDLRDCGVTLAEIKRLIALRGSEDSLTAQREILTTQAAVLHDQIDQLQETLGRLEDKLTTLPVAMAAGNH